MYCTEETEGKGEGISGTFRCKTFYRRDVVLSDRKTQGEPFLDGFSYRGEWGSEQCTYSLLVKSTI